MVQIALEINITIFQKFSEQCQGCYKWIELNFAIALALL